MMADPLPRSAAHLLGLLAAVLPLGCGSPPAAEEEPPPAPVEVVRARQEMLDEWMPFDGTTQPLPGRQARITAAVQGTVRSVLPVGGRNPAVAEGARVHAGQVLVQLDDRIARENLAQAKAAAREVQPQLAQAQNAVRLARDSLRRLQRLRQSSSGSGSPLVSKAEIEQAQGAVTTAEDNLKAAQARQRSSAAQVETLVQQLRLYTLRATIDGWLGTILVVPGQTISAGTPVADIVDLREIDVLCLVPPSRIGLLALGEPARLAPEKGNAGSSGGAQGKVVYIARQAQPETGCFEVKTRFPNEGRNLRANLIVRVLIRTAPPRERLVIPLAALREDREPPRVAVVPALHVEKNEKVGKVRIFEAVLGVRNRRRRLVEILGLRPIEGTGPVPSVRDAWFVVAGGHGLEDGDEVRVTSTPAPH